MENPQVTVEQGILKGITGTDLNGKNYYSFFGIPYAKPPLGNLRFKDPQPPEKWTGIREAIADTGACYSRDLFQPTGLFGSEDCLVLNVYTPELPQANPSLKPVMVWIHGGGLIWGSNYSNLYGPQFLITEDVVIVAINYRLGFLGFISTESPDLGISGNACMKDMVMALKWVQANIKHFNGDPNNVTIFGESAGGGAVNFLVLSPMAKGLFHRAISQSGYALSLKYQPRYFASDLAKALNYTSDNEADILTYLQSLSFEEIHRGQEIIALPFLPLGPTIENVGSNEPAFFSEDTLDIISSGDYNKVPLMIGYTEAEQLFTEFFIKSAAESLIPIPESEVIAAFAFGLEKGSELSKDVAKKINKFYYGDKEPSSESPVKRFQVQLNFMFIHSMLRAIKKHLLNSDQPIYLYRLTIDRKLNFLKVLGKITTRGTAHADDLGYLFKTYLTPEDLDPDSIEIKTVRRMVKMWANFARTGNPNPVDDVTWLPVTKESMNYLDIGEKLVPSVNPDEEIVKFWDSLESWINESKTKL